jgi:hypothetical protein
MVHAAPYLTAVSAGGVYLDHASVGQLGKVGAQNMQLHHQLLYCRCFCLARRQSMTSPSPYQEHEVRCPNFALVLRFKVSSALFVFCLLSLQVQTVPN